MKTSSKIWFSSLALLLALVVAPLAVAQDDPFEINGDVDNDGMVGPTDIQHVINDALGLNERGPDAVNRPLRQYIVASPRASLALRPGASGEPNEPCDVVGAATNFQRRHGRLLVRKNTGILFRFDRNVEGVWHDDACGLLRSQLIVQIRPVPTDSSINEELGNQETGWETIGRDGAFARTCGPAVATANIGVRHRFEQAGDFLVRSIIRTWAIPESEVVAEGEPAEFCGAARDVDIVLTRIRVVDRDATPDDIGWQTNDESPAIGREFGDRMENGEGDAVELP